TISNTRVAEAIAKESDTKRSEGDVKKMEEKEIKAEPKIETTEEITFDDFSKLDIRIGTVVTAEPIKKSNKLMRLEVNIGEDTPRQLVAGIKESHEPEQIIGRQVVVLANLKPAKLCGVKSKGMVLAGDTEGAVLLMPEKEVAAGTKVR
ncbi:MAG: methionine--tRNA ligase subunit beta, partial [Nanoarchaeota archaeon]|nr:methionine--tRNA ligase subunit beta [Nanoarchaeota archaeon]